VEQLQKGVMEAGDKRERLKEFYLNIRSCDRCDLSKTRTKFVFGSGSAEAQIMFVGEAPGKNEDLQGLPFVGQAGKLLDELLGSIGYDRSEVFIANVLKCRPPGNRDPRIEEINTCKDYLMEQIKIIDPKIICTLGRFSTQLLLDTSKGISGLRGKIFRIGNHIIMPINHPAAALYAPSKMGVLKEDFQKIKRLIDSDGQIPDLEEGDSNLESGTLVDKQEKGEQLGLF
jgi:DNA polymerase